MHIVSMLKNCVFILKINFFFQKLVIVGYQTRLLQRPKLKKNSPCLKLRHGPYLRHDPPRVLIKTRLRHGNRVLAVSNIVF